MGLHIVAEALARIEHKLDALLRHQKVPMPPPMHFAGALCPACGANVDYQVDLQHNIVVRKCQCKTGKFVSTIPLFPVPPSPQGATNGRDEAGSDSEDSAEREAGRTRNR